MNKLLNFSMLGKKVIITVLSVLMILNTNPIFIKAEEENDNSDDFAKNMVSQIFTSNEMVLQTRYVQPGGHGFAAEEVNSFIDVLSGKKASIVGYDNVVNGPDRVVVLRDGTKIFVQDKYLNTPSATISECFDPNTGMFKYFDSTGKPMQIEVPKDQYDKCVELMKKRIQEGKVPGVDDPEYATKMVKKGSITYQQAVNLTKAGTIDSLLYDSKTGAVTALTAFGISTTFDLVIRLHNGEDFKTAIAESSKLGVKSGATAFAVSVVSLQLLKTEAGSVFRPAVAKIVETFGDDFASFIVKATGAQVINNSIVSTAVGVLQSQALISTVTVLVVSAPNAIRLIQGKISAKQMIKDFSVTVIGVSGAVAGGYLGSWAGGAVLPGVGNWVGGFVGSTLIGAVSSYGAEKLLDLFVVDDADEMLEIIENEFVNLANDYLISDEEAQMISSGLQKKLTGEELYNMFASDDRNSYAKALLVPLFEEALTERKKILMPSPEEMREELKEQYNGIVFIH